MDFNFPAFTEMTVSRKRRLEWHIHLQNFEGWQVNSLY